MKFKTKFIIITLVIVTFGAGGWLIKSLKAGASSQMASSHDDIYYCPMHPQIQSNHPGVCPICSMNLVKKENNQTLSAADRSPKKSQDICLIHNCPKLHDGAPCPMMVVTKEGEILKCPICGTFIGEKVGMKKILYWTDPMIPGFKSDKPGKSPMGMDMVPVFEEEGGKIASGSDSVPGYATIKLTPQKQQLIGVRTAKVEKKELYKTIRTVGTIARTPGWVEAQIYQYERPLIKRRQDVEVTVPGLEGVNLKGQLRTIDSWVDPATRTSKVNIWITNPQGFFTFNSKYPVGFLAPGMYVNVSILIDLGESLSVSEEAVFNTGTRHIVFVDQGNGLFEPRDVTVGAKTENEYQIKSGLKEGEVIVVSGNFLIDSESRLQSAFEGMSNTGNPAVSAPVEGGSHEHAH